MASSSSSTLVTVVVILCCWYGGCQAQTKVSAVYVFGDSLADVGNNNHLGLSLLKADFPHNGVDFPGHKATGRFSNGKNSADFLGTTPHFHSTVSAVYVASSAVRPESLGLPTSPAYLSIPSSSNNTDEFLGGVNFASGGGGVLDSTNKDQCISFNKQIDYYSSVYAALVQQLGSDQTQAHLSNSVFAFVIGSNDILNYVKSSSANKLKNPPQQFVDSLISSLRGQLKRMYNLGARKFVFIGTGPIGCCPAQRHQNKTRECSVEANYLSVQYNKGASSLLQEMSEELSDMSYSYFDTYTALLEYINNPDAYGFVEVKAACCGLGDLNAKIACLPISSYCSNRKDHIFWDLFHPTEATAGRLTSTAFDGSVPYVYPMNIRQLVAILNDKDEAHVESQLFSLKAGSGGGRGFGIGISHNGSGTDVAIGAGVGGGVGTTHGGGASAGGGAGVGAGIHVGKGGVDVAIGVGGGGAVSARNGNVHAGGGGAAGVGVSVEHGHVSVSGGGGLGGGGGSGGSGGGASGGGSGVGSAGGVVARGGGYASAGGSSGGGGGGGDGSSGGAEGGGSGGGGGRG
ncbi:hypothetical protein C4D60_Mb01t13710 [Musa balbisiana]|uniref:GDSL esterase/lipase n=1 Tax=Musa balbisiana TaxID=52838 RepID=A0A4V4H7C6_MUSBA|nr:hypothetical protein C4D60_Mb01t13710 [Musa balbisiana]